MEPRRSRRRRSTASRTEGVRFTQRLCDVGHLHAVALLAAHRQIRLAPAGHRGAAGQRRADHRPGARHAAVDAAASRLPAPVSSASGTSGLGGPGGPDWNTPHRAGTERDRFRLQLHHGCHRRPRADRLRRERPRRRTRPAGPDPRRLRQHRSATGRPVRREPGTADHAASEPRPRPDHRQRRQPHRLHDRRQGGAVARPGHGRHLHAARPSRYIEQHQREPFFLFFATHDPHVPRVPHERFVGKSGMGPRGDAILQSDWSIGQLLDTARPSEARRQHPRDLHQRQRPRRRRRVRRPGGGEAGHAHARPARCAAASTAASKPARACRSRSAGRLASNPGSATRSCRRWT